MTIVSAQTFSRGHKRLIQNYLNKFVEMTLRVPIQCNMGEISVNRKTLKNKPSKTSKTLKIRPFSIGQHTGEVGG